ncbi:MAG: hypothetical protein MI867_19015 [Pseudomonadales bacterium]|nr:hypothetical protein [Pseudomonadales bacterium]
MASFTDFNQDYGAHAWWDWWVLSSMLKSVGDVPRHTYYPVLRMMVDDPEALEKEYQQVLQSLADVHWYDSPRVKWRKSYGNFVRELEFVLTGLKPKLSEEDFQTLVVKTVSERLNNWIGFIKPAMAKAGGIIPRFMLAGADADSSGLKALYEGNYGEQFTWVVQLATFLVGPMETSLESEGVLKVHIPECAMHTTVSPDQAQVFSCLYACKAACEAFLDEDSPMQLTFEPNIPELNCTMRVFFKG